MKNVFLYGSLRDIPLLEIVLGHKLDLDLATPATLDNHRLCAVRGQNFPMLREESGQEAEGLLLRALGDEDLARLDYYEGAFDYARDARLVRVFSGAQASGDICGDIYWPAPGKWQPGGAWPLSAWQTSWGPMARRAAREAMGYFGHISPAVLGQRMLGINLRASSWVRAGVSAQTTDSSQRQAAPQDAPQVATQATPQDASLAPRLGREIPREKVRVLARRAPYCDFFQVQEYDLEIPRFAGGFSPKLTRAVFTGADVAIVLPYDPVRDLVVLVEQFRVGCFARGAQAPWSLEPVAGHVDPGETPETAARRETDEECGVHINELEKIASYYPSPGDSSEYYFSYLGLCNLGGVGGGLGGLEAEHEDIRRHVISFARLMALVQSGEANNAPLILAAHWLALNRTRLRRAAKDTDRGHGA